MGGKQDFGNYFPPIIRDRGGEIEVISPHYLGPWGGNQKFSPPFSGKMGGKCPPQAENLENWSSKMLDFLKKNALEWSRIRKIFRLRRALQTGNHLFLFAFLICKSINIKHKNVFYNDRDTLFYSQNGSDLLLANNPPLVVFCWTTRGGVIC